uniref:Uncharacterized protein n=1 Tax=Chenopodium quinoa TaxID=63459 RepID=A0A803LZ08_CHEQI
MGGGMEASKNKFIEEWGSARENLEHNFRWTRRNFALIGIFGIALPVLVYKGIVREFLTLDPNAFAYLLHELLANSTSFYLYLGLSKLDLAFYAHAPVLNVIFVLNSLDLLSLEAAAVGDVVVLKEANSGCRLPGVVSV